MNGMMVTQEPKTYEILDDKVIGFNQFTYTIHPKTNMEWNLISFPYRKGGEISNSWVQHVLVGG